MTATSTADDTGIIADTTPRDIVGHTLLHNDNQLLVRIVPAATTPLVDISVRWFDEHGLWQQRVDEGLCLSAEELPAVIALLETARKRLEEADA